MYVDVCGCMCACVFQVLLLDEITVDLDVLGRADLMRFLVEECETRGATIIYATHIFDGLEFWPTHVAYVARGKPTDTAPCMGGARSWAVCGLRHASWHQTLCTQCGLYRHSYVHGAAAGQDLHILGEAWPMAQNRTGFAVLLLGQSPQYMLH